jgi:hypothetical protein
VPAGAGSTSGLADVVTDVDATPRRAVIAALPQRRTRRAVTGHEQRAVWILDEHRLARDFVDVLDALSEG